VVLFVVDVLPVERAKSAAAVGSGELYPQVARTFRQTAPRLRKLFEARLTEMNAKASGCIALAKET